MDGRSDIIALLSWKSHRGEHRRACGTCERRQKNGALELAACGNWRA